MSCEEKGLCLLCEKTGKIHKSHIIPHFVNRIISEFNPHKKHKSKYRSWVVKLLCSDCEMKFCTFESKFASIMRSYLKNIKEKNFKTLQKKVNHLEKDNYLQFFCVSVLWRILAYNMKCEIIDIDNKLSDIYTDWKNYLNQNKELTFGNIYLIPGHNIENFKHINIRTGIKVEDKNNFRIIAMFGHMIILFTDEINPILDRFKLKNLKFRNTNKIALDFLETILL